MTMIGRSVITIVLLFFILCPLPRAFAMTEILSIRNWAAPDNTRIVIDTSDEADTAVEKTDQKITIDFGNTRVPKTVPAEEVLNKPGIHKITVSSLPDQKTRVELWLSPDVETRVFKLKAFADKPFRVVIDIGLPAVEKKEVEERQEVRKVKKDRVIVIDPGHGGDDPGAVGRKKTREKDVVLKIAKKLEKTLNGKQGYKAFLTRRGDYYPSFNKRLRIAREYGADLFLSIHADAWRGRSARGSSVYCLSTTSASSVAARLLASEQNLADILGGAENDQSTEESDPITLHMVQTETMNISRDLGATILGRVRKVNPLKFHRVQYAPFRILKLPEIPSVLIETAYISNPKEEALLRSPAFQTRVAEAIALSVYDFYAKAEGKRPAAAAVKEGSPAKTPEPRIEPAIEPAAETTLYKLKRGDTLDKIARRHNTTIAELLKLNRMKLNDPLLTDRKLKVPVAAGDDGKEKSPERDRRIEKEKKKRLEEKASPAPAPAFSFYTVRKGDTLDKIARRHNTTISALLKLNRMKLKDPLYSGRKLKVPAKPETSGENKKRTVRKLPEERPKTTIYRVKRGDTLEKIAKKHDTTIAALLKANGMKLKDPLHAGRKLKIP
jgi:N-acetylmuramoyl-L-alanine amidase